MKPWLTMREAVYATGVPRRTLRRWVVRSDIQVRETISDSGHREFELATADVMRMAGRRAEPVS